MGKDSKKAEKPASPVALPTLEPCGICLEKIAIQGALPCCKHSFCFPCIQQWAKVTNRCPICKQTFKSITERLPEGKEKIVNVKSKEQDHQYTLQELNEAIGDDDSEEDGPEWYFIDRDAEEASDDYDEEDSIERQRKEGYHYYDQLHNEVRSPVLIDRIEHEESRDSKSIELSDQDWAAQDRESYSSDGGFVVDDDHVSYSKSEDSLDLADQGKVRKKRRSSDMDAILSTKSAEKMIQKAKKKTYKSANKDANSGSSDSDSSETKANKKGKRKEKEETAHASLLDNFRELMYNRRFTPKRRRLRKLAKRLSMSPRKAKGPLIVDSEEISSESKDANAKKNNTDRNPKFKKEAPKISLPTFSSSSSSSSSDIEPATPPKKVEKKAKPSSSSNLSNQFLSQKHPLTASSQSRPKEKEPLSSKLTEAKRNSNPDSKADSKSKSTLKTSSQTSLSSFIDLSQSPPAKQAVPQRVVLSKPVPRPNPASRQVINLVSPSPSPQGKHPKPNHKLVKSPTKLIEIPKIVTKASLKPAQNEETDETSNKKRKREEDAVPKSHVQKKSKKE